LQPVGRSTREAGVGALAVLLLVYLACSALSVISISMPPASSVPIPNPVSGNITLMETPVNPVRIDGGQIGIGDLWTYIYHLRGGHRYHVYLLGDWANPAEHRTDYDIFVFEISSNRAKSVSSHTESAGLPEQVSNDGYGRYFTPSRTGTYYFTVVNDPTESSAAEAGTLMVIERIELNRWYSRPMHGKVNERPVKTTTWAYEFNTSADRIRVYLDVPDALDMYEARLYIMANPGVGTGQLINGVPVAWEPGLQGEQSGVYGGFNLDPQGFRHVDAMASCEHSGEDMVINYEPPVSGNLLYHLALIAEYSSGTVDFIIQTDFDPPELQPVDPPSIVEAGEQTVLTASIVDETALNEVSLSYSVDGGSIWRKRTVEGEDGNFKGTVPAFPGGTVVDYIFEAVDEMGNIGEVRGSYEVISSSTLELLLEEDAITGGDSVRAYGRLNHPGKEVEIQYRNGGEVYNFTATTDGSGGFRQDFTPEATGEWEVSARFSGDYDSHPADAETLNFTVTSMQTSLTCTLSEYEIELGERTAISGAFSVEMGGLKVELSLTSADNTTKIWATTLPDGSYSANFQPSSEGSWSVQARVQGDGLVFTSAQSATAEFMVSPLSLKTRIFRLPAILIKPPLLYGFLGAIGGTTGVVVFYIRRRE